jgi:predicted nuclease of predicted toxin-antitoxin system
MHQLIKDEPCFEIIDFTQSIFEETMKLRKVKEIHDRIITASARVFEAIILTKDKMIMESGEITYY